MGDGDRTFQSVAERIATGSVGEQYPDALLQFIEVILETQRHLLVLERRIADTGLTFEGYRSQRRLDRLAGQYNDLCNHVEQISQAMLTCRVGDIDGVDVTGIPDDDAFLEAIRSGSIPRLVGRLERISARVNQQLVAKQNAATTRMVAVVSAIAAVVAIASLFLVVLPGLV